MRRCVDSGLWVPEANSGSQKDMDDDEKETDEEEPIYANPSSSINDLD